MVDNGLIRQQVKCEELDELEDVAQQIIDFSGRKRIWLFEGEMGAGKTTLIKAICEQFDVLDTVNSPTFAIVNEYQNETDQIFYHFDFYRLKNEEEALDIGATEYFDSGNYCFIEWPSKVQNILPEDVLKIEISITGKNSRIFDLTRHE